MPVVSSGVAEITEKAESVVGTSAETQPSEEEETQAEETQASEEPVEEVKVVESLKKGMVKVKVITGTLQFEDGSFEKGETFIVSKKRASLFDPKDIEIL